MMCINCKIRLIVTLMTLAFITALLSNSPHRVQATAPKFRSTLLWQIPRSLCHDPNKCKLEFRVSNTETLYVLNLEDWRLSVFLAGQKNFSMYYLSDYFGEIDPGFDFLPIGSEAVLIYNHILGKGPIYRYELATRSLSIFAVQPNVSFTSCSSFFVPPVFSMTKSDSNNLVLGCSVASGSNTEQWIHRLNLITVSHQTIQATIDIPGPIGSVHPWYRVLAGNDGQIYMQDNGFMFADLTASLSLNIRRRSPDTTQWDVFSIADADLLGWDVDRLNKSNFRRSELISINTASDMYIDLSWYDKHDYHFRLAKVSWHGEVEWAVTENDFGGNIPDIVDITSDGKLVVATSISSRAIAFEIWSTTVDNASTSTVSPTNIATTS